MFTSMYIVYWMIRKNFLVCLAGNNSPWTKLRRLFLCILEISVYF